jgi:putative ABC transport system permease protein
MLSDLLMRLRALFRREAVENELHDELRFHFERQVEKYVQSGFPRAEATRRARLEFGGDDQIKEECRETRGVHLVEVMAQDIRYGFRILARNWKPAGIAAFSLAIAMSLSVIALSVCNGVLLRPPLAAAPDRLVTIYTSAPSGEFGGVSYPDYKYYRDNNRSFSGVAAFPNQISKVRLIHGDLQEMGAVEQASDNYFSVMGIRPFLGQLFIPGADDKSSALAILTYPCWKRWGADPKIIGKTVSMGGNVITIVGVTPRDFTGMVFGFHADLIINLGTNAAFSTDSQPLLDHTNRWLFLVGRLRSGATRQLARADLRTMSAQLASAYPDTNKDRVAMLTPTTVLAPDQRSTAELISGVLIGVVLLVLLIACANVASLLLGIATGRKQEILIRSALGATRGRLLRQLLTESLILSAAGGTAGFILASALLARFSRFSASVPIVGTLDVAANLQTDGIVIALTLLLICLASLASGLSPALYASEPNIAGALSGEAVVGGTRKSLVRDTLVVVQIAVCTMLIAGVGLCLRSLHNLREVNRGFSAQNLASVMINFGADGFSEAKGRELSEQLRQSAAKLYGVESQSLSVDYPLLDDSWSSDEIAILGANNSAHQHEQIPGTMVDENYFETFGIPILAGRAFNASDDKDRPEVLIVNHNMAETYWPGENPLGKQVHVKDGNHIGTVVGVVADSKYNTLDEQVHPVIYYALSQHYSPGVILTVRTSGNPRLWVQPLSQIVRNLGLQVDVPPFTLDDALHLNLLFPFLTLFVVVALGALALMLAILGLYGSIFYSVNERKKEIGIRVALGATPSRLIVMFLRRTAIISGVGISVGLALSIAATIVFKSQFYEVHALELHVLIPVALIMLLVAMAIAYVAVRPWINVDPIEAVRHA